MAARIGRENDRREAAEGTTGHYVPRIQLQGRRGVNEKTLADAERKLRELMIPVVGRAVLPRSTPVRWPYCSIFVHAERSNRSPGFSQ